jgi:transcriptional regulator with XRE-family HTH domain
MEAWMLGELVRGYRRRLGMTQEELAESAEVSVRSIRKIEAGVVRRPRPSTLRALADAFDLSGPARAGLYAARSGPQPRAEQGGEPFVVVAIDTTARRPDVLYFEVRVRSEDGEYGLGPFPVQTADRVGLPMG